MPRLNIEAAYRTLVRGTTFLGGRMADEAIVGNAGALGPKVIANGLRELDRFLGLLIDEAAALTRAGRADPIGPGGQRNTANKLRSLHAALGSASPHHARLRALGRSRDCLFHCDGIVRRADERGGTFMTAGWPPSIGLEDAPLMTVALGEALVISTIDIRRVCDFYDQIAADLVARKGFLGATVALPLKTTYIRHANVACDGT